jgi:adenylosuccinate synthase
MSREALLVVDLAFGDCGKGSIVDHLVRTRGAQTVVRFSGGPQAGHNVVTPDGRHHTFSQFGSGTFVPGVRTILSRFMLIEPYALLNEDKHLAEIGVSDALLRLHIDPRCRVITPIHQAANRLRELARGDAAHGSCGLGVGETVMDSIEQPDLVLYASELGKRNVVRRRLRDICDFKLDQLAGVVDLSHELARPLIDPSWIDIAADNYAVVGKFARIGPVDLIDESTIVFEGAQGVLLDESFGFHPHTTWSTTTFAKADVLLDEWRFRGERTRIGVLRSYFTRHGPGPFVTDDPVLREMLPEPHNDESGWQGRFRVGPFDLVVAKYALNVVGHVDQIAMTHLDRLVDRICVAYENNGERIDELPLHRPADLAVQGKLTEMLAQCRPVYEPTPSNAEEFVMRVEEQLGSRVGITSFGPTANDKCAR